MSEDNQQESKELTKEDRAELAKQVESAMLEKEKMSPGNNTSEDTAAATYILYQPLLFNLLDSMSAGGIKRVLKALILVPLHEPTFKFQDQKEEQAFHIADQLMLTKAIMILKTLTEEQEALKGLKPENQTQGEPNGDQ